MTEQSDGVTDARIQAAKVIAVILGSSYREPGEGGTGAERSLPISERESSMRMGGRWSEGMGSAELCTANDRADKRHGAGAEQKHDAHQWVLRKVSIPLFFTPFKDRGVDLVDGGILNPVPVAPTIGDRTDMTIAVNLGGSAESVEQPRSESPAPVSHSSLLHERISRFINNQRSSTNSTGRDWGGYDIAIQAFEAMQDTIARQKLAAYPPDIIIDIARNACRSLEYDRASEMIDLGYRKAEEYLFRAAR